MTAQFALVPNIATYWLNATAVESGQRIVVAPVDVATEQARYVDALDGVGHAGGTKVPLGWMLSPESIGALNERLDEVARSDDVRSVLALLRDDFRGQPSSPHWSARPGTDDAGGMEAV